MMARLPVSTFYFLALFLDAQEVNDANLLRFLGAFQVGDRVIGIRRFGGYATKLNVDWRLVRPLPSTWSFAEGAGHSGLFNGSTSMNTASSQIVEYVCWCVDGFIDPY